MKIFWLMSAGYLTLSCTSFRPMNEIKHIGFQTEVQKGKSVGQIEGDDCAFGVLGYWIGGNTSIGKALANARTGKKTTIADVANSSGGIEEGGVRYLNNVRYEHTGWDAYVAAKSCIQVSAKGYK